MIDQPFLYDEDLAERCALESDASSKTESHGACETLFRLYSKHYKGNELKMFEPVRFQTFVQNVRLVHHHNGLSDVSHRITLNKFSHVPIEHLPWLSAGVNNSIWDQFTAFSDQEDSIMVVHLGFDDFVPHGNGQKLQRFLKHHSGHKHRDPQIVWSSRDSVVLVNENNHPHVSIRAKTQPKKVKGDNSSKGLEADELDFDVHLNWATTENPDGVPIVHPPSDQV